MHLLLDLWWSSLVMVDAVIAGMGWLVVARILRGRTQARRAADRQAIMNAYLALLRGEEGRAACLGPYLTRSGLLAETFLEVLALVRGIERDRLVSALSRLDVDGRFRTGLTRGDPEGRLACAEALAAFPSEETREALERMAEVTTGSDRFIVLRSLLELGAPSCVERLLVALSAPNEVGSSLCGNLLCQFANKHTTEIAKALDDRASPPAARAVLAEALGFAGDYAMAPRLILAAADPDAGIRAGAVRGLGHLGHPFGGRAVAAALCDPEWTVRAEGLNAAARIGLRDLIPSITERLQDDVWWVRFRAAEALSTLGQGRLRALKLAARSGLDVFRDSVPTALDERDAA